MTRRRVVVLVLIAIVPLLIGGSIAAYSLWYQSQNYVTAASARISGSVIQVTAPAAGEVMSLPFDTGETVTAGQTVARLQLAAQPVAGTQQAITTISDPIRAPRDGTIIRRFVHVGERAASGTPILDMVDLSKLYVVANVDEDRIGLVRVGEPASVYIHAFDKTVPGVVAALTPATSDLITAIQGAPRATSNGSTTPTIPVIVDFDSEGLAVFPGMTVDVTIQVQ
ncbi:MAG: efflux RND transporter periplasmic adaptor subunit [Chloroflexi bacterium]|nr:efflux RND transporter periplasmic adaptor subunit [Chloroflexota bacterium]